MSNEKNSIPSVSVTYAHNGSSTKANALGMRPMQERAYEKRALKFKQERGRLPSLTSPDAWEKRMAEGVAFLARMKAEAAHV